MKYLHLKIQIVIWISNGMRMVDSNKGTGLKNDGLFDEDFDVVRWK